MNIWDKPRDIAKICFRVGLVMQYPEYQLFDETVRRDIAFAPKNLGLSEEEIDRRVREAASFVGIDESWMEKSPFELSGGQKRRVAIAGILAMEPEVLVLDEPAAGLDPMGREEILGGLRSYQRQKKNTMIIVSHSMEDVAVYCDRLTVLAGGKVFAEGNCAEVFKREKELTEIGLGVPQITRLVHLLRDKGIDIRDDLYTVSDVKRELARLLPKKSSNEKEGASV